jgi:hypothetical protein
MKIKQPIHADRCYPHSMASTTRATQEKKRRERSKQENKAEKGREREVRKELKKIRDESLKPGEDPDLVGIFPGPHNNIVADEE